jgi:putative redox protein
MEKPPPLTLELVWSGDFRFRVRGRAAAVTLDGDAAAGPSPMEALLAALGSCAATDVVDILHKGRQPLRSLSVRLAGERREEVPRRFTRILAEVVIGGPVERAKAERAVRLAFEKYCSVRATLDPAMPVETRVVMAPGEPAEAVAE